MQRDPKIFVVPIEPFPGRYTQSWYDNFPRAFATEFGEENVEIIDGSPLSKEIKVGTFLDINSTIHYKNSQMMTLARLFEEGQVGPSDVFFFGDIEFWGLESLRLMADMNGLQGVKITGFLHAASYTREDAFAIASRYQRHTEIGWIASMDRVYVGSHYHKNAVNERRLCHQGDASLVNRIMVSGNPMFRTDYLQNPTSIPKKRQIILPNRFDSEKRAYETVRVAGRIFERDPTIKIILTTSHSKLRSNSQLAMSYLRELEAAGGIEVRENLTKLEYHTLLAESAAMITLSIEENFGYCIAEALYHGCYPLMRQGLSHVEFLHPEDFPECFFSKTTDTIDGYWVSVVPAAINLVNKVMDQRMPPPVSPLLLRSLGAAELIAEDCKALSDVSALAQKEIHAR